MVNTIPWEELAEEAELARKKQVDTTIRFTMRVEDPDAMVAWAKDQLKPGCVLGIVCYEQEHGFLANVEMNDAEQATLLKTFWAAR